MAANLNVKDIDFKLHGIGGQTDKLNEITRRTFLSRTIPPIEARKLGIKHTRGVLLYGPPGCGKTLIARTIGKILNCTTTTMISGPELLTKWVGESEENVRKIFKKTKDNPHGFHLIIIDEFDSVGKHREGGLTSSCGVSERVVNELLACLDGPNSLDNFVLIVMTNFKECIDKALLRPGRIEVHIKIDLPTKEDIVDILNIHTKNIQQNNMEKINFSEFASDLVGYTCAEVEGIVKAAVSRATERYVTNDKKKEPSNNKIFVKKIDFKNAVANDVVPMYRGTDEKISELNKVKFISWNEKIKKIYDSILSTLNSTHNGKSTTVYIKGKKYSGKFTMVLDLCDKIKSDCVRLVSPYVLINMPAAIDKIKYISDKFNQAFISNFGIVIIQDFDRIIELVNGMYNTQIMNSMMILLKKQVQKNKKIIVIITGECDVEMLRDLIDNEYELEYNIDIDLLKPSLKKLKLPYNNETKKIHNVKELFAYKHNYENNSSDDETSSSDDDSDSCDLSGSSDSSSSDDDSD